MDEIRNEVNTNSVTNYSLLSDEDKIKLEDIVHPKKSSRPERLRELVTDAPVEENESIAMMGEPMIQESVMEERGMEEIRSERGYDDDTFLMARPEPQDEVQSERSFDESPVQSERGW
jgi:hypothetical protein